MDDFEAFFEDNYGSVWRAVALTIGDRSRAEDVVQEAFSRAYRRWRTVSVMERPVAWVYVVALNAQRKEWNREQRRVTSVELDEASGDHAGPVVTAIALRESLLQLTGRQRAAVVLRYLADLNTADVAQVMGCAEGTVKATLHQALRKLRVDLEDEEA